MFCLKEFPVYSKIFNNNITIKEKHIFTSGWPKNQKRCWYKTGSPPPAGSKKVVLKLRSVNNIVIAAAKTGKDNNNNTAVIRTAQTNKGI